MDNKINIINENGMEEEVEILDFYQLDEYDHEYVLYTKGEEEGNDVVTYISIINETEPGKYTFNRIENEEEFNKINKVIEEEISNL